MSSVDNNFHDKDNIDNILVEQYRDIEDKEFKNFYTQKDEIYNKYKDFCKRYNIVALKRNDFEKKLKARLQEQFPYIKQLDGQIRINQERPRVWYGLRPKLISV